MIQNSLDAPSMELYSDISWLKGNSEEAIKYRIDAEQAYRNAGNIIKADQIVRWLNFEAVPNIEIKVIEKPKPQDAPSLLGIQGRYVFTSEIFNYQKSVRSGSGGEIQLTDAMKSLARSDKILSWNFGGKRYDIGTMKDWFQSHLELSIESDFSPILESVLDKL